ncbi:hypothetical protein B0H16DRAFT_1662730 [Mycena metata]|uniref:G domain-containing protein n=1 Tax=Mycena metata TaxID=1033252 RepID=A0AAD7NDP4_9AGAR|nr:hypothetical protein B0H16DRAFT_1662730 [Mycena metata]
MCVITAICGSKCTPYAIKYRVVTLIDTPGFDDTLRSDTEILTQIASHESEKRLTGIIYLHRISDDSRKFKMFRQLCRDSTLKNVCIVTNMWGEVGCSLQGWRGPRSGAVQQIFKPLLDKGACLLRHDNNIASAQATVCYLIGNQPRALRIQRELVDQGMEISQTSAGEELNRELAEQIKRYKVEMAVLQQEIKGWSSDTKLMID